MMNPLYNGYTSEERFVTTKKAYYTTRKGFPNRKAFEDYGRNVSGKDYYLCCMTVDLKKANQKSYDYGSLVLRRFILSLIEKEFAVFHITGEKFNILVESERLNELREFLDERREDFCIYYGVLTTKTYTAEKSAELVREGVTKMYQDKAVKKAEQEAEEKFVMMTPPELQETVRRKFRSTTWYAVIELTVTEPEFKSVMVYVFPTEFQRPLATLKTIVVVADLDEYRAYYGKSIDFGVGGALFTLSTRFDRQGLLNVAFFKTSEEGECKHEAYVHKGVCIPSSFGKRIGNGMEIYPIRQNVNGFYDYIMLDKEGNVELNRKGIVQMNGVPYGVQQDDKFIELLPQV